MIIVYDTRHRIFNLFEKIYLKVIYTKSIDYHLLNSSSLLIKKTKSFHIKQKVSELIYVLKFSKYIYIHTRILVIQLKQNHFDDHEKDISVSESIKYDNQKIYIIKQIVKRKEKKNNSEYIIK